MSRQKGIIASMLALAALLAAGCGEDSAALTADRASAVIGAAGGTIALPGGGATLQVPLGALAADTRVTLTVTRGDSTDVTITPEELKVSKPLRLTLTYGAADLPAGSAEWLRLVRVGAGGKQQPTKLASLDAGLSQLTSLVPGGGKYRLADLKTAGAVVKTIKKKVTDVDLLFVVDNSGSMAHEQKNLSQNFPKLMKALDKAMESYRVGVISTDLGAGGFALPSCAGKGDAGKLQTKPRVPGCTAASAAWIEASPKGSNVAGGDVAGAFSCVASLGTGGCGFEQPLEAAHLALKPGTNPGFLRKDAALALVFISDEDDCSASNATLFDPFQNKISDPMGPLSSFRCFDFGVTCDVNDRTKTGPRKGCKPSKSSNYLHPVDRYLKQLKQLKPAGQVVVSAIVGPSGPVEVAHQGHLPSLKPSCTSTAGNAFPAVRLGHFVDAFGKRGATHSICSGDFSPALDALGKLVTEQTQLSWCLPYDPTDTDPLTKGTIEGDCVVVGSKAGKIPACGAATKAPCHRLVRSQTCGKSSTVMELENIAPAALGDEVYAVCLSL